MNFLTRIKAAVTPGFSNSSGGALMGRVNEGLITPRYLGESV